MLGHAFGVHLAADVMDASLRALLLAIAVADLGDEDGPRVVGLRDEGAVVYTGDEATERAPSRTRCRPPTTRIDGR